MRLPDLEQDRCDILLVEDNPRDVRLTREALRESGFDCQLSVARNGAEALDMLRRIPPFEQAPAPDLILLDINLPVISGRDVLAEIKQDSQLCSIPVIMLTTSRAETDVKACYDLHANSYLAKPLEFDEFTELMRSLHEFWISRALLPPKSTPEE